MLGKLILNDIKTILYEASRLYIRAAEIEAEITRIECTTQDDREIRSTERKYNLDKKEKMKPTPLCQSLCRDNTDCLNRAKYGDYCWRHCEKNAKENVPTNRTIAAQRLNKRFLSIN